jgi:hypothetical protein
MTSLAFLGVAVAVFVVLSLISWIRHRERRTTFDSSIERFRHEMDVLSPPERARSRRRR